MSARPPGRERSTAVIVPVKGENPKGRLSPLLSPSQRRQLQVAMLEDTLQTLIKARMIAHTFVVSSDRQVLGLVERFGATSNACKVAHAVPFQTAWPDGDITPVIGESSRASRRTPTESLPAALCSAAVIWVRNDLICALSWSCCCWSWRAVSRSGGGSPLR